MLFLSHRQIPKTTSSRFGSPSVGRMKAIPYGASPHKTVGRGRFRTNYRERRSAEGPSSSFTFSRSNQMKKVYVRNSQLKKTWSGRNALGLQSFRCTSTRSPSADAQHTLQGINRISLRPAGRSVSRASCAKLDEERFRSDSIRRTVRDWCAQLRSRSRHTR